MVLGIELALKAFEHIAHAGKTAFLKSEPGIDRQLAAAADQDDRAVLATGHARDLVGKMWVDLKIRLGIPFDVDRINRVAYVIKLGLGAAIDQQGVRIVLKGLVSLLGGEMVHMCLLARIVVLRPKKTNNNFGISICHPRQ